MMKRMSKKKQKPKNMFSFEATGANAEFLRNEKDYGLSHVSVINRALDMLRVADKAAKERLKIKSYER
jgi:hypothetical protein